MPGPYWHRFFHHQPDLNYDNPDVCEAMLAALRFWLDLGLDGFLTPSRTSTNVRARTVRTFRRPTPPRVRTHIDDSHPDTVLLAEANQWRLTSSSTSAPATSAMAFHFPVMPRMFMALRREEARPIYEILAQTPAIPDNRQWACSSATTTS